MGCTFDDVPVPPAEAGFRDPLEDASSRRLFVKDTRYVPFVVPTMSETAKVPSPLP